MWDWELLKNRSGSYGYEILAQYGNEDFQYTRALSHGTERDEFYMHNHSMYELVYCLDGDVVYLVEGVRYKIEPHSLLIIYPAVPHKLFLCSERPFERHTLYINYVGNTSRLSELIGQCPRNVGEQCIGSAYFGPDDVGELEVLFERMNRVCLIEDESIQSLLSCYAQAAIAEILLIMHERYPRQFSVGTSRTVDALLLYLSQNFRRKLTLEEIAEKFYISKDYCNRVFRQAMGMTVMQYVIYSRVLYAKELLANGVSATEAAEQAGFSDYSNFYRSYRKITGRTPREDH